MAWKLRNVDVEEQFVRLQILYVRKLLSLEVLPDLQTCRFGSRNIQWMTLLNLL